MHHNITNAIKVLVLAATLSLGLSYVYAWTAPTVAPTGGNVSAPINVGSTAQTKAGDLTVAKLGVGAAVDPSAVLNVLGTIKTTELQLTSGAASGKLLTSDAVGNLTWQDPVQAGGGGLPEEVFITTTQDILIQPWMTKMIVELVGGGGSGGAGVTGSPLYTGSVGGASLFGYLGSAPMMTAAGGAGGVAGGGLSSVAASGTGSGGTVNKAPFALSETGGIGGRGGPYTVYWDAYGNYCSSGCYTVYGGYGGPGGYSKGLLSLNQGQTVRVTIGNGGAVTAWTTGATAGAKGYARLTYMPAPELPNKQVFTSNGTFTVPSGVSSIRVRVWGGGGAGVPGFYSTSCCGGGVTTTGGGGGASGGYAESVLSVVPGTNYNITVGAGGAGQTTAYTLYGTWHSNARTFYRGNPGGTTTFGSGASLVTATGGQGGVAAESWVDGGAANGLVYCSAGTNAVAGAGTGNYLSMVGTIGGPCNQINVGAAGGLGVNKSGYAYGAGGNGSSYGGPQYNGGSGAVVVSW